MMRPKSKPPGLLQAGRFGKLADRLQADEDAVGLHAAVGQRGLTGAATAARAHARPTWSVGIQASIAPVAWLRAVSESSPVWAGFVSVVSGFGWLEFVMMVPFEVPRTGDGYNSQ